VVSDAVSGTRRRRAGHAWRVILAAAALVTCTSDHPTGPGRFGRGYLMVRPVVSSPVDLAAFGLTIDSLRVIAIRPVADTALDTTAFFSPDSTAIHLSLAILLHASVETFVVHFQLKAGALVLFQGVDTVQVSSGAPDTSAVAGDTLQYVGPGAGLTTLRIAPRDSAVTLGDSVRYTATADSLGVPVTSFFVHWSTSDSVNIPINAAGLLRAPNARGSVIVRAITPGFVKDSTRVTFVPVPAAVAAAAGSGQSGTVGTALPLPLRARVTASDLLGVPGVAVKFQVVSGGGGVKDSVVVTDSLGFAEDTATLGTVAGAQTFRATVGVLPPATFTATGTPGAISPAQSVVTVSSATVASGTGVTLTLRGKDQFGNNLTAGGATVAFSTTGGSSTGAIGPTTDVGDGTYTATFTGLTVGTATTVGATINGTAVTTTLPTITVTAGAISPLTSVVTTSSGTVSSGATATLTLQAKDSAGNALTTGGATVVFSRTGGTSTGTIGATTDHANGTYTAVFTADSAGTATTIQATIGGVLAASTTTITVVPGNTTAAQSVITVSADTIQSSGTSTLTLQGKDSAGNNITTGGLTVVFSHAGGTSTGSIAPSPATDNGNGTYTATFTGQTAGTATTINATIDGAPVTSTLPTITVITGGVSTATSVVTSTDSVLSLGGVATLTLQAKDAAGNPITTGGATVVFTQSGGTSAGTIGATTDHADGTYTATFTATTPGTATTIGATVNGNAVTSAPLPTIRVFSSVHTADITADSIWTAAASPHIVGANIRVRNGATLTIEAGATVKFDAGTGLQIGDTAAGESGRLAMDGGVPGILLTANTGTPTPGFWKGIEVERALSGPAWRRATIEYGGGVRSPFGGVLAEACVLIVNRSGAALDLDSLRIRQCVHAAIHHFGGTAHVHRSTIDTVSGSAIHVDFDAQLELDSTTIRRAGQEGLFFASLTSRLLPSSGNRFLNNVVTGIHLNAMQLPGLLLQDSIVGNGTNFIEVQPGRPDSTVAAFTILAQPQPVGQNGYLIRQQTPGLLDIGRVGGQSMTLDSNVVLRFENQTGLVIGDSAGTRTGSIHTLATNSLNRALLIGAIPSPGSWLGVEIGRLAGPDTIRNLEIQYAGDSLPGRTVHRGGLWVRSPVAVPLVLDSLNIVGNGSSGAVDNSGGVFFTAAVGSVDVLHSNIAGNPGYGIVTPDRGFKVIGNVVQSNAVGLGTFAQGGTQITPADSIAGNSFVSNGHAVSLTAGSLRAFYDTVIPANLTDTLILLGGQLTANARLPRVPGFVWHVVGGIVIDSGATLTITAGDTVTFDTLAVFSGPQIPGFVLGFPALPAAITIGGLQPGALAAAGTAANPILLTSSIPGRGWAGIHWAKPEGVVDVTNNVFTFVTVERAGYYAPCFGDCSPTPFAALRLDDTTNVNLVFDHVVVRGGGAYAVDFERFGTGTLTISNSQLYNNGGGIRAHSGHGDQLTVTGSDLYNYRGSVVDATYSGLDSVNANGNWWGDLAGPYPGFNFSDSLGRGSFGGTAVRAGSFAGTPFFPVGPAARLIAARDTFLSADTVLSLAGQSDSLRVRVVDAQGRGVPGLAVSWTTSSGVVTPGSGASDLGGRVGTSWVTGSVAGQQTTTANGVGTPVVFPLDLLPGNTTSTTVDWTVFAPATGADSIYTHPGVGTDTIVYSSSNHVSAMVTHARDTHGNVTFPNFGPLFDQGPCSGFVCRFPAADSTKGDTVYFRPPEVGDYVISGEYESGLGGTDQIVLRVKPVAAFVRIDRDVTTQGIQDTGSFTFNSQCRAGAPVNIYCARQFDAFVVDSGGAPILSSFATFNWATPSGDTTVTPDSIRGPANDNAFVSAHANGPTYLVTFDINDASPTFGKRDSMPILVDQRPGNLVITPPADTLVIGDSTVFTARVTDQGGDTMPAVQVHWRLEQNYPGLTILDTAVFNQVKVRLDSAPSGQTQVTAVTCCTTAQPPFDSLFGAAYVYNPVQIPVTVGTAPGDVSVNPVTQRAYVALGTDSVAVVDVNTGSLLTRIPVPLPSYWTAVNTVTDRVYVGSNSASRGYMIDAGINAVVDSFDVGSAFFVAQMAVDEARNRLYVPMQLCVGAAACVDVQFLGVLDGSSPQTLIDTVPIIHQGVGTAYNPTSNRIYVATSSGTADTVRVIDATTLQVVDSIAVGGGAYAVAVNPVTGKVYVATQSDHSVWIIDGATDAVITTVSLGFSTPNDLAVDTVANLVYVAVSDNQFQFVIDGADDTSVRAILLDGYATGVAVLPGQGGGPVLYTQFNQNILKILRF